MRRYGGDRLVLGRVATLNGQPYEIVGVLPPWFDLPREVMPTLGGAEHADVVLPLPLSADAAHRAQRRGLQPARQAQAGRPDRDRAGGDGRADGAAPRASIRTSIPPTAA